MHWWRHWLSLFGLLLKDPTELPLLLGYNPLWQSSRGGSLLFRPVDALDV